METKNNKEEKYIAQIAKHKEVMDRQLHPLMSKNAKHYDTDKESHIYTLEEKLSVAAMAGFCEGNISKYEYRLDSKGQKENDLEKIAHYKEYFNIIKDLLHKGYKGMTVQHALKQEKIFYRYTI